MRSFLLLWAVVIIAGCSDKFEQCIEDQKETYRKENPTASFSMINAKYKDFESRCYQFRRK
jgi:hypothetical protein